MEMEVSVWGIRHLVGIFLSFQFVFRFRPYALSVSKQSYAGVLVLSLNLLTNFMMSLNQQIEELGAVVHHHSSLYLTFGIFYHTIPYGI